MLPLLRTQNFLLTLASQLSKLTILVFALSFVGHLAQLYFNECDGSIFILNSGFKENDIKWQLCLILISVESWTKPLKMLIWILTEFKATDLEKF